MLIAVLTTPSVAVSFRNFPSVFIPFRLHASLCGVMLIIPLSLVAFVVCSFASTRAMFQLSPTAGSATSLKGAALTGCDLKPAEPPFR